MGRVAAAMFNSRSPMTIRPSSRPTPPSAGADPLGCPTQGWMSNSGESLRYMVDAYTIGAGVWSGGIGGGIRFQKAGTLQNRKNMYLLNKSWTRVDKFHQHFILHEYH